MFKLGCRFLRFFLLPLLCSGGAFPQSPSNAQYADEAVLIEDFRIAQDYDDQGSLTHEALMRLRVQSEAGVRQLGTLIVPYDRDLGTLDYVYVRVAKPDGTTVETPLSTVLEIPSEVTRAAPQYTSTYEKHVNVRGLGVGDILEYRVRQQQKSTIQGHFWTEQNFLVDGIVLNQEIRISFPAGREVKVKSTGPEPVVTEADGRKTYAWKSANSKRLDDKERQARAREREEKGPDIQVTSFRSWEELGSAARDLFQPQGAVTPAIRAKAEEITKGVATEAEKTQAIYAYVATKFRYIGVSFGVGRIQPHPAAEVLSNGFGDCKDKHVLLSALLQAAGISSYPALIHVDRKLDPEVPSPLQFNHVVTAVPQQHGYTWLDTTLEVAPFGFLIDGERDKQVLLVPEKQAASLVKTPAEPVRPNRETFKAEGTLGSNGTLEAQIEQTFSGDSEIVFRGIFRNVPRTSWEEVIQRIMSALGLGGKVSDVDVGDPEDTRSTYSMRFRYTRENYSDWENKQIVPPLPPISLPTLDEGEDKREFPLELGAPAESAYEAHIKLPPEYQAALPPKEKSGVVDLDRDFAHYRVSLAVKDGVLNAERKTTVKQREVSPSRMEEYKEFRTAIAKAPYYIVLNAPGSEPDPANAEADRLVREGVEAMRRRDYRLGQELFRKATEVAPKHPEAWRHLGLAYLFGPEAERGVAMLRKQIQVAPSPLSYRILGQTLMFLRRSDEGLEVLREFVKAYPDDGDAKAFLGSALLSLKRYEEAIPLLEEAVAKSPSAPSLNWSLGQAYLGVKKVAEGRAALAKTLDREPTPTTWNNYAYVLAEHGIDLDEAQGYAAKAVEAAETDASGLGPESSEMEVQRRMGALLAYWDTLGWVYFRKGDLEKAESYLTGSWEIAQAATPAEHLGDVLLAKGDKQMAAKFYARALAAPYPLREHPEQFKKLVPAAAARERMIADARGELSKIRTTRLRPRNGVRGTGEFQIVLGAGNKVLSATLISGDDKLKPLSEQLLETPLKATIPGSAEVKLVHRAMVVCPSAQSCDLVIVPPSASAPNSGALPPVR